MNIRVAETAGFCFGVNRAVEMALDAAKRLNHVYMLGQLMFLLMLTVAYEGELADVDAYDQPGVEVYKRFMKAKL